MRFAHNILKKVLRSLFPHFPHNVCKKKWAAKSSFAWFPPTGKGVTLQVKKKKKQFLWEKRYTFYKLNGICKWCRFQCDVQSPRTTWKYRRIYIKQNFHVWIEDTITYRIKDEKLAKLTTSIWLVVKDHLIDLMPYTSRVKNIY